MLTLAIIAALMILFGIICRNHFTYRNEDYRMEDREKIKFSDYILVCIAVLSVSFFDCCDSF